MDLKIEDVRHIARLARLDLSELEISSFSEQLSAVLQHFAKLQSVDTSAIETASSVLPAQSVLRSDVARPGLARDKLLENAPETDSGQFRVPPVLE